MALQIIFAILVLKVPGVNYVFEAIASVFTKIIQFSDKGANFLFGDTIVPDPEKVPQILYDTARVITTIDTAKVFQVYTDSIGGNVVLDTLARPEAVVQVATFLLFGCCLRYSFIRHCRLYYIILAFYKKSYMVLLG